MTTKTTIPKSRLIKALSSVVGALPSHPTSPALSGVLLSGGTLTASDLLTTVRVPLEGADSLRLLIPGKDALDRIKSLPDGDVALSVTESALTAKSGNRTFKLPLMSVDEYPTVLQTDDAKPLFECKARELAAALARVAPAITTDESRPHLMCARLESDATSNTVTVMATDGHNLLVDHLSCKVSRYDVVSMPAKAVTEIRRLLDRDGDASILTAKCGVVARIGDAEFQASAPAGQYPPWRAVLDSAVSDCTLSCAVSAPALRDAIKACAVGFSVRVTITPDTLRIESRGESGQVATDRILADASGAAEKWFAASVLTKALADCGDVEIKFSDDSRDPIIVTSGEFRGVAMPMSGRGWEEQADAG